MSIVPKESIEVIAQSIGVHNLSEDAALLLAPDVEYRIRHIMQESIKCMRHSSRTLLSVDDVHAALNLTNLEPIYGIAPGGSLQFKRAIGHRDLFYIDDKDIDFKDVIEAPLPKAPLDTSIVCHWLAIDGVQPAIPENAPLEVIPPPTAGKNDEQKEGLPVDIKLPVKHVLSRELQLYFDKITELIMTSESPLFKEALVSLATDTGLHPLVPYFTCFIADEVSRGLSNYQLLVALMRVVWSLLQNPHIHIEPYLHQLMPSVVTCLVAKRIGNRFADNHWELRDFTANLVASICKRFGHVYSSLQTRLTKTLVNALLDPKRSLTQHYGAVQGLAALGPNVVRLLLLPNLEPYLQLLEPELVLEKQKNEMKRHEAWRVYGALLHAAGLCIYSHLKIFPPFSSPPPHVVWKKTNAKIDTSGSKKRKASTDHLEEPAPKKIATDGPVDVVSTDKTPSDTKLEAVAPTAPSSDSTVGGEAAPEKMPNNKEMERKVDRKKEVRGAIKTSAILGQVWKDELKSGKLVTSLFELFGEGMLSFIPSREMSLFL
ncbi:Transcription initiation factor TFIID subunit 6 [Euphorbia peplus]|nr:Transcription initiation factor TFIID subunit 6 [Euphorbia peplus]